MKYDIIILCGGYGSRVKKYTNTRPKCLIEFNKKPFIYYQLKILKKLKINKIIISTYYKSNKIKKYLDGIKNDFEIKLIKEPSKLGTCGAIRYCLKYMKNNFFILYGDSYLNFNYKRLKRKKNLIKMAIYKNKNKFDKSNITIKKKNLISYTKNNNFAEYIDYGISCVSKKVFKINSFLNIKDLSKFYEIVSSKNFIECFIVKKRFYEIGSYRGIKDFKNMILKK